MSKLTIALAAATAFSAATAMHLWRSLDDERTQRAQLQTQIDGLERSLAQASASIATAESEPIIEAAPTPANSATPTQATGAPPPLTNLAGGTPPPEMWRRMQQSHEEQLRLLQDPEYRELMRTQQRTGLEQVYADVKPLLGLSDAESERLIDLLTEQAVRSMEQPRPMLSPRSAMSPDDPSVLEMQRAMQEQRQRNETEIAALLGPKYRDWQEYQQNGWSRSQVTRLRHSLALTDEPLRPDQLKPLVEAIAREQRQINTQPLSGAPGTYAIGANAIPPPQMQARWAEDMLDRTKQSQERIRRAVSGLLSPSQYEQLVRQQEQELRMHELSARQRRARAEAMMRGEISADFNGNVRVMP